MKVNIIKSISPLLTSSTIVASNTSSISITKLAAAHSNPQNFIGIIYCPVKRELFEATVGNGAFLNGMPLKIVADGLDLIQSLVVTEFGATGNGSEESVLRRMSQIQKLVRNGVHGIRMLGSAAYNLTRLVTNSAQLYFEEGIHTWDIAAGALIVKEAGGIVSELPVGCYNCGYDEFRINGRSIVASASQKIHKEFLKILFKQ